MFSAIDELVDALSQSLQRSVTVDDADLRLLEYSPHFEEADPARVNALVGRGVSGSAREYIERQRVKRWTTPTRLPVSQEHGFHHDRLGFPLRSRYELLGFMWVIDDRRLSDEELQTCLRAADDLVRLLERRIASRMARIEDEALVFGLLSEQQSTRLDAVRQLGDLGVLTAAPEVSALVVTVPETPDLESVDILRRALSRAILNSERSSAALAVAAGEGVIVVGPEPGRPHQRIRNVADRVISELAKLESRLADGACVGIGNPVDLADARTSYQQATTAVRIGQREGERVVAWADRPLDGLLDALLRTAVDDRLLPPIFGDVLAAQPSETLKVIGCFLDRGGNAAEAAKELHLHRTTVYYRLSRFAEATGLDLDDGRVRLMVQLWLTARSRDLIA